MKGVTIENEYAYIKDGKVFLKGYMDMPDRQIGEVKRTEEEAFQYFVDRYDIAVSKVQQLEDEIQDAQNKGSYLTKLLQLRKRLLNFDGIGPFEPLLATLDDHEVILRELIADNQANNLAIKETLIEEAKVISESENWMEAGDDLQDLRTRWIRTGPVDKDLQEDVETRFRVCLDKFYQRRKAYFEEQNRIINERLRAYDALVAVADELARRTDWDEAFVDLKRVQAEWKVIGKVPPKLLKNPYTRFKKMTGIFYEKYCLAKGIQVKKRLDPRVEAQIRMVKEAEKLSESDDIFTATNRAKVLLNEWKTIRVPPHLTDRNISERFRAACDKIFELSYLMKVVARKHPSFKFFDDVQQLLIKFREMENIVRRARTDLDQLIDSYEGVQQSEEMEKLTMSNLKTQKRKLLMKEIILEELRQKVANL
ncbi:MAG: DUF349 domain-containing protein [Spirosomataceae bacterium]